jgi:hypothetical protein
MKPRLSGNMRYLLLVPLGLAIGDFAYGFNHYIFRFVYTSSFGPLTYAIPYIVALAAIVYYLVRLSRQTKEPKATLILAHGFSAFVFLLNVYVIIIPSLLHKTPALSPVIAVLTVIFSLIESWIVGFSAILIILTSNYLMQLMLLWDLTALIAITAASAVVICFESA